MTAFIRAWADTVTTRRHLILLLGIVLLPVMLFTGKAIPFDNTTERYFVSGDPALENFEYLIDLFGDYEYLIVGIEQLSAESDVFNPDTLDTINRITGFFDSHRFVTQVRSLTNYQYTHADRDAISTDYLIEDVSQLVNNPALVNAIRNTVRGEELALGTLVSEDFRHARITARVEYRDYTAAHKVALAQEFYQFIAEQGLESEEYALHYSGYPLLSERFETLVQDDMQLVIPVMGLLMFLMLFLSFRSPLAMVMPGLVIGVGVLGVNEIQSYLGAPHSTVDQALLPTMIIIGVGITVHVLVEFYHAMRENPDSIAAARLAIIRLWKPAFFTTITTSAGFLALSVIRITPIRDFALLGAIGPLLLFLFAMTLLPALLSFTTQIPRRTLGAISTGLVSRFTGALPDFTSKHHKGIIACGLACLVFAVLTLPRIQIDTNYITQFKQASPVRQDILYLDRIFRGVLTLDIILDSGAPEGVKDPEFLRQVEAYQAWLESRPSTGPVNSLVDYLKEISQALNGDNPDYYRLPDSREMAAQFLLLYDSSGTDEDLSDIKDFDNRFLRLIVPIVNMAASEARAELDTIETYGRQNFPALEPILTGGMALRTAQDVYAAQGMSRSFGTALLVISLFFFILFRSFKYGVLSLIPSVLPIVLTGGIAGVLGVYLDLNTMLVGAMTMGIAVDDSIHVMSRYLTARKSGASTHEAIDRAMNESGRAVIFTSAVLVLGFSVFCLASFTTIIYVGLFGSIIMLLALLGDLLLLPALLFWIDGKEPAHESRQQPDVT
ncbi:MAG: efflux RND transporter permease subunit [Gammaproteobacteria bacterium]